MKYIIRLFKIARPWWRLLIISSIALLLITGINLVSPSITKEIISLMENGLNQGMLPKIITLGLILLGLYLLRAGFTFCSNYFSHVASWRLVCRIRHLLYQHFQSLPIKYFEDKQTGQLMSRVINDTVTVENLIAHALPDLASNIITLIGVTAILLTIDPMLTLLISIPLPFLLVLSFILRRIRRNFRRAQKEAAELSAVLQDNFSGMKEIQLFNRQEYELGRVDEKAEAHSGALIRALKFSGLLHPCAGFISSIGTIIVLILGPIIALSGGFSISDVVAFLLYLNLFYAPVSTLARILEDVQQAFAGAERVFEVLDTEPEITDLPGAKEVGRCSGQFSFEQVSFAYSGELPVLKDLSFSVNPGEMVALVGPTGVGKTTISSLLARFYEADSGQITIDGINIRDMTLYSLREQLSMVLQDVFLFNGTIADNIAYGYDGASREEIISAAKTACVDEFINTLPNGYDTQVGERGVRLSGGQKQRISIARSILRNSPILVLDEATSAVDTKTETQIQKAIDAIAGTRTLLVIAHRLSTVKKADKIIVLENGYIAESGKHEELLAKQGVYAKLCNIQNIL